MTIDGLSKKIVTNIKSTDPVLVLETIGKIRESGNSYILEELIELLHNTIDTEIKKSILNLLSELKNKDSVPILIASIKNERYLSELKDLVTCCWQNGMCYNEYLPVFIDIVIQHEFLIAFEAFTVIENMYGIIDDEVIEPEIIKLKDALENTDKQKLNLLTELLTIIRNIPHEQEFNN